MRGKRLLTDALAREHQPRDLPVHRSNAEPDLTPNISSSSAAWHYSYDLMGHQTGATPPTNAYSPLASTSNSYGLSGAGRLDTTTTGTRGTTYYYDVAGRQYKTDVTTSTTLTTTLTLDSLGRQTSISTGSGGDLLAETYDAVNRLTSISRASLSITTFTYNADGTAATRTDRDGAGTAHLNTFTYTTLGQLANAGLPDSAGSAAYTWGLDGNMATRTWGSSAITGTYRYDGAKRPISLTIARTGQGQNDVISRTYDLVGNVTAETQTLARSGGSGSRNPTLAYGQTESFTYDAANRVTASSFDGSVPEARTYTYDADGNRRSVTEAGVTFYYFYDATDALVTKNTTNVAPSTATLCADRGFCYDAMGDLTTSSPSAPDGSVLVATTYTYDPAGHLLTINSGLPGAVSFLLDALGRHWSQTSAGTTTTYAYLGSSDTVSSMSVGANVTTTSLIDAIGDRLGQGTGSAFSGWLIADLHGNIVAAVSPGSSPALLSAYRYDAYGETCGSWSASSGSIAVPWRFQGRLLESGSGTDLYDFGARSYDPSLGAFTSFDSVAGSAQNPLTLNRYLYANANPATLVDPDGHCASGAESGGVCESLQTTTPCTHERTTNCTKTSSSTKSPAKTSSRACTYISNVGSTCGSGTLSGTTDMTTAADAAWAASPNDPADAGRPDCHGNWFCDANNAIGTVGDIYTKPPVFCNGVEDDKLCRSPISGLKPVVAVIVVAGVVAVCNVASATCAAAIAAALKAGGTVCEEATCQEVAAGGGNAASRIDLDGSVQFVTNQSTKMIHIFDNPEHNLDPLVQTFGSRENVVRAVVTGLANLSDGRFDKLTVMIGGSVVVVSGTVQNGVIKIGTMYIP